LDILHRFFSFLKKKRCIQTIGEVSRKEVREYIKCLQDADKWPNRQKNGKDPGIKLSPSSIQGHVRAIKVFWGQLAKEVTIENEP